MRKRKDYKQITLIKKSIHSMNQMKYTYFIAVLGFCFMESVSIFSTFGIRGTIQGLQNQNQDQVIKSFFYLLVVNLGWWIYMPIGQYMLDQTRNITMKEYKEKVVEHMMRLPMSYYDQTPKGELMSLLSNDMGCLSAIIHWNLEQLLRKIAGGVAGVVLMFVLNPWFAMVVLLLGTTAIMATQFFNERMWKHAQQLQQKKSASTCSFYELIKSAKNLRLLKLQSRKFLQVCDSIQEEIEDESIALKMEHVTFGYDEKVPILKDFSMRIRKKSLAVVEGESGTGKSTLVKLLLGLYKIQSGQIDMDTKEIAYVPQEATLFRGTVYENLICANETATMEQVRQALLDSQALSFVEELPDGMETMLFDDGNGLSGGQKQRLALARALVKDADILLLDEVTSALDRETTRSFMETLKELKKNRTILFVTHDKTMETLADQIIQM